MPDLGGSNPTQTIFRHAQDGGEVQSLVGSSESQSGIGDSYRNLWVISFARCRLHHFDFTCFILCFNNIIMFKYLIRRWLLLTFSRLHWAVCKLIGYLSTV